MIRLAIVPAAIAIATAALIATPVHAAICSPGYKPVRIDGNWVCQLDVQASTKLKAPNTGPTAPKRTGLSQR